MYVEVIENIRPRKDVKQSEIDEFITKYVAALGEQSSQKTAFNFG